MLTRIVLGFFISCLCVRVWAQTPATPSPFDAAAAFGARPSVSQFSLSPDGTRFAYVVPQAGQGSAVYTRGIAANSPTRLALRATGDPERIAGCKWVDEERLVCEIYGVVNNPSLALLPFTRIVAVNADGSNVNLLSTRENPYSRGYQLGGGAVIDWLPEMPGHVLMTRIYLPDAHTGSRAGSTLEGLGVDLIDTRTLAAKPVEAPKVIADGYLSDGHGTVRIEGQTITKSGFDTGIVHFLYRLADSRDWHPLGDYNSMDRTGFYPAAVDRDLNVAYGFKRKDGRLALYSMALDGTLTKKLVFERPDVDVDSLVRIGRRQRVVGAVFSTDYPQTTYFDPAIERIVVSLTKALPTHPPLFVADSSTDESKLLVFASSDTDPGVYYLFDRSSHHLDTLFVARDELEGVKLAQVRPITYPATDGTAIPAYLTLPPGHETVKGLPAIVLPHGGPSARDEWGFDWLSQFYAARGFAVLQPNFRGSSGYGDAWFQKNGFQSWPVAIDDVLAAGRWLVGQELADPAKLAIVGWSYGGYAALQAASVDPTVFKAVIAIAPVTDLEALKEEHRVFSDYDVVRQFVGAGPHVRAGSPIERADKIKVPVLLFHGAMDRNVHIAQSKRMAAKLAGLHADVELVTWDKLDHYLDDSKARTDMLRKSDAFLHRAMGF